MIQQQLLILFFKNVNRALIYSDPATETSGPKTSQQITSNNTNEYVSQNGLDPSFVYRFRVALDNRATFDDGTEFWQRDTAGTDISENLLWREIPDPSNVYIELGAFGPAEAPTSITFSDLLFNPAISNSNANHGGVIDLTTTGDMDASFNTGWGTSAPIKAHFGFDISGNILSNSKQMGSDIAVHPAIYRFANRDNFEFADLSYNTDLNFSNTSNTNSYSIFYDDAINSSNWYKKASYGNNGGNGITRVAGYPEHVYDISGYYCRNDKFEYPPGRKVFAPGSAYDNLNEITSYATRDETSNAVYGTPSGSGYLETMSTSTIGANPTSTTAGYVIDYGSTSVPHRYGAPGELKKVRNSQHNIEYAIFLNSSSTTISGGVASEVTIKFNDIDFGTGSFPDGRSKGIYNNTSFYNMFASKWKCRNSNNRNKNS